MCDHDSTHTSAGILKKCPYTKPVCFIRRKRMASATLLETIIAAFERYVGSGRKIAPIQMGNGRKVDTSRCTRLLSVKEHPTGLKLHWEYPQASHSIKCSPSFGKYAKKPADRTAWQVFVEWVQAVLCQEDPKKIPPFPRSLVFLGSM